MFPYAATIKQQQHINNTAIQNSLSHKIAIIISFKYIKKQLDNNKKFS